MEIGTIMVVGAGLMGRGIAEVAACSGYKVIWSDVNADVVRKGMADIERSYARRVEKKKVTPSEGDRLLGLVHANVSIADDAEGAIEADLVIEAVTEDFELKQHLHASLGEICKPHTVIASNTSTFSITALGASSKRPDRFIGLHFFSPVPVMRLVEVVRGILTSDDTCRSALAVIARMGKEAVLSPDIPGFVVSRIILAWYNEAMSLVASGVKPEDIDKGVKLATNCPMGPLETADYSGLHVVLQAFDSVYEATGDVKFKATPLLRNMVRAGLLGRKTGRGFYDYTAKT